MMKMFRLVQSTVDNQYNLHHWNGLAQLVSIIFVTRNSINKLFTCGICSQNAISPLHVAAKWGQLSMIVLLLERNAYTNIQTRDGLTPLHCAARSGYVRVVDYLLERNADHSAKTRVCKILAKVVSSVDLS